MTRQKSFAQSTNTLSLHLTNEDTQVLTNTDNSDSYDLVASLPVSCKNLTDGSPTVVLL